jgi:hypothetical protein
MQTISTGLRLNAWLPAAALSIALLAPGPIFAAGVSPADGAGNPGAASASDWRQRVSNLPASSGAGTQIPESGQTQLPDTPDTPRPHYGRPPVHLP